MTEHNKGWAEQIVMLALSSVRVHGRGSINEMMMHIQIKLYANIIRQFTLVGSSLHCDL